MFAADFLRYPAHPLFLLLTFKGIIASNGVAHLKFIVGYIGVENVEAFMHGDLPDHLVGGKGEMIHQANGRFRFDADPPHG